VSDPLAADFGWVHTVLEDRVVDDLDASADWSLLLVALGTGLSSLLSHHFSSTNDEYVLAAEFLLELSDDFDLDFLPADDLWGWDHEDQSVSSADIDLLDSHNVELHKLFLGSSIGTVLDFEQSAGDVVLDVGGSLVVLLLKLVCDREDHVLGLFLKDFFFDYIDIIIIDLRS